MNVKLSQGAIALGVLTLLFGGDLYGMLAGQSIEVGERKSASVDMYSHGSKALVAPQAEDQSPRKTLAKLSENGRVHIAYCTS